MRSKKISGHGKNLIENPKKLAVFAKKTRLFNSKINSLNQSWGIRVRLSLKEIV